MTPAPQPDATPTTLGDALPREMARIRDEVIPAYMEIGPAGGFALTMMRQSLDDAAAAMVSGDVLKMIRVYNDLKRYTT